MFTKKEYSIWFSSIKILPIKKYRLIEHFKEIKNIYHANQNELLSACDIDILDIAEIELSKNISLIKKYEEYINKNEISVIDFNDKLYPSKLKNIYDPPAVLYAKGNLTLLKTRGIAIVGSRLASNYGKKQSYDFAYNLAKNDITIVSGLAKGIDSMAHSRSFKCKSEIQSR